MTIGITNLIKKYHGANNLNLSLPKLSFKASLSNNWPTTNVVPNAPNGMSILDTTKSILSKIVPAPNVMPLKLLNDNVSGILIIKTNTLAINAIGLRFVLSFLVKLETLSSNSEIDDVKAANKKSIKNIK